MNITVYHGSHFEIKAPLADTEGNITDFGQGFYLTNSKKEAEFWAKEMALHRGGGAKPIVSVYSFNYFKAKNIGYRFNEFETYNIEWLKFIIDCRKGRDVNVDYDIVIAGAVNKDIVDIIEDYEKGNIDIEETLDKLRYKDMIFQICISNQEIIDFCLEFVDSYIPEY